MGNVRGYDIKCGDIHGKEFLRDSKFHHEFHRSHSKKKFDITAKLVNNQDEINSLDHIQWGKNS